MYKTIKKVGALLIGAGAVAGFGVASAMAGTYDATSSIATINGATSDVGTILAAVIGLIVAIVVGLMGLNWGIKTIRRKITGGKF